MSDTNATLGSCDAQPPGGESWLPGASVTCSATHTVTQSDLNAANITNVAHATGNPPGEGAPVTGTSNTLVIDSVQSPALSLDKTADTASFDAAGTLVTYSYLATNTGNVTLDPGSISVTRPGRDTGHRPTCGSSIDWRPATAPWPRTWSSGERPATPPTPLTQAGRRQAGSINNTGTATRHPAGARTPARSAATLLGHQRSATQTPGTEP